MLSDRSGTQGVIVVTAFYTLDNLDARISDPVWASYCCPQSDPQGLCIQAIPLLTVGEQGGGAPV